MLVSQVLIACSGGVVRPSAVIFWATGACTLILNVEIFNQTAKSKDQSGSKQQRSNECEQEKGKRCKREMSKRESSLHCSDVLIDNLCMNVMSHLDTLSWGNNAIMLAAAA